MIVSYTTPSFDVTVEKDVVYGVAPGYWTEAPVGDRRAISRLVFHRRKLLPLELTMDIYLPVSDGDGSRPLLLMMHGGSFFIGHKDEPGQVGWCRHFASLGYVAVSINYRLGFQPDRLDVRQAEARALEDAETALAFILSQAHLRVDPDRVFLAGTSAGAILALQMAYSPERTDCHIRAIANLWGAVRDLSVLENARVPILSFQSVEDPNVPYDTGYPLRKAGLLSRLMSDKMYGTHAIHRKALSLGIRSEHHPCPEAGHRLHLDKDMAYTPRFFEIRDAMTAFFAEALQDQPLPEVAGTPVVKAIGQAGDPVGPAQGRPQGVSLED